MENIMFIFIIIVLPTVLIVCFLYFNHKNKKRLFEFFKSKLSKIKKAVIKFESYLDNQNGYFANYELAKWNLKQKKLFFEIKNKKIKNIKLKQDEIEIIKKFKKYFNLGKKYRDKFNIEFVKNELEKYSKFFENIEGRSLDNQQREAIVKNEDNNLVIAGAGSGKTTTIIGKVNYIIDRYKINPNEILLISFTKKSASTLSERINIKGIEVKTFHKFGKDIITKVEGKQPTIFDENKFKTLLKKYLQELISNQKDYLYRLNNYFIYYSKPVKTQFDFNNMGNYIQYMKDQNFRTYKTKNISINGKITFSMEIVKSIEECVIANFLLFNGIEYEYEAPYEYKTANETYRQYKPDFTIFQNGKKYYLEHFAISKNGDIPSFFCKKGQSYQDAKSVYLEKINWARKLHKHYKTPLIETYSYQIIENNFLDNLKKNLNKAGIILNPKSPEEVWKIINESASEEVNSFIELISTFIVLMKSNDYSFKELIYKNKLNENKYLEKRNDLFLNIIKPINEKYKKYLLENDEIDFSDMINKASNYIKQERYNQKIKYILIDEFQDISIGRYKLIRAIKNKNPSCKLFCVGDDWQSIYRFSGSDITLFKKFEKYFGFTIKSKIETTYRFCKPLLDLSSNFIQKNPSQSKKDLKASLNHKNTNYEFIYSNAENQDITKELQNIFNELFNNYENINDKKIFVLGRYNYDLDRIKNENNVFNINKYDEEKTILYENKTLNGEKRKLEASFMTIHKSKGLEADIVIIINCSSGKYGFPSERSDDPILNLLLSESDQFENGEERRLFYVAMTRAKEKVYFIVDNLYKSKFINELEITKENNGIKKCPQCITADLIKHEGIKNGKKWVFWGCSNYLYGCDYKKWEV